LRTKIVAQAGETKYAAMIRGKETDLMIDVLLNRYKALLLSD
jgi:hypothetical protein